MIKRQYFTHAEVVLPDGKIARCWRQHYWISWFPDPESVVRYKRAELARENGVPVEEVLIKSFNRC